MKFTFKNVSNTMTVSDVEKVLDTPPRVSISAQLKQKNLNYIEPYYRDNMMKLNNLDGVLIKLPIYTGNYITLKPEEEIVIETENVLEQDFYKEVCASFNSAYPVMGCKEEDDPTPTTDFQLIREDGAPIYDDGVEIGREFIITQTLNIGDNYKATLSNIDAESVVEDVTIQDLSSLTNVEDSYGFSMWDDKFGVVFNATTEDGSSWVSKPGYVCAFGGGDWIKIVLEPTTPPTSMLPFPINTSDLIEANDNGWFNNADSLDLVIGNSYKLSFVTDDNSYDIIATAESVPSFDTLITLNFDISSLPIQSLIGDVSITDGATIDPQTMTPSIGDGFMLQIPLEGSLSDFTSVVKQLIIDNSTTPPQPVIDYTIPFEIPASWFEDIDVGGSMGPIVIKDSDVTNLTIGNTYKLTLYDKNDTGYSITGVAYENEGLTSVDFEYDKASLPEDVLTLFGTMGTISISLINDFSFTAGVGNYFTFFVQVVEGKLSADIQAVIDKFYIEEV